jgi:sugar phosphate isomerase/epimerase
MTQRLGNFDDFGMATITLAGPLQARLAAIREAGFSQVMLEASDIAAHPGGLDAAAQAVKASGLRVTGLQWLRDFEGLSGRQHIYKVEVAKAMLQMAQRLNAPLLLVASSVNSIASQDPDAIARDLRKLSMLAVPVGIRLAYEGMSWSRTITDFVAAWDVVCRADAPNLGLAIDSAHTMITQTAFDEIEFLDPRQIFVVRLADFMEPEPPSDERRRMMTSEQFRVFPGEGMHRAQIAELVMRLAAIGYRGDYSFEVYNEDYQQLPAALVAQRARAAAEWLGEDVLRRSAPLPGSLRLRQPASPA